MLVLLRRAILPLAMLVLACCLVGSGLEAKGKLDTIAKFRSANLALDVDTYFDPERPASDNKAGLLSILNPPLQISFAFGLDQTDALIGLWTKAAKAQSATWKKVGSMKETGTQDISELTVSSGPGVRFVIASPERGAVTYNLASADIAAFRQALNRVKDFLAR